MDDFMSPEDLISSETLGLMERSISSITTAELVACVSQGPPKMWPSELDPATRRCIDDASTGWADGPPDDEVTSSDRIVERDMSAAATRAGYLVGRILLGTVDEVVLWSNEVDAAVSELTETLERLDFSDLDRTFVGLQFIEAKAADLGYAEHESLVSMGLMAFDNALALALLEHDRVGSRVAEASG